MRPLGTASVITLVSTSASTVITLKAIPVSTSDTGNTGSTNDECTTNTFVRTPSGTPPIKTLTLVRFTGLTSKTLNTSKLMRVTTYEGRPSKMKHASPSSFLTG